MDNNFNKENFCLILNFDEYCILWFDKIQKLDEC